MGGKFIRSFLNSLSFMGVHYYLIRDIVDPNEEEIWHERQNFAKKVPKSFQNICWYYQQLEW